MTEEQLLAAAQIRLQKFGVGTQFELADLLPSALSEFLGAHMWEFLTIAERSVSTASGQTYIQPPTDFLKIVTLRRTGYEMEYITPGEYARRKALASSGGVAGISFTQKGGLIYVWPDVSAVTAYTMDYYPNGNNLQLSSIPAVYHKAVQRCLEKEAVPLDNAAWPIVSKEAYFTLERAIAIDQKQPVRIAQSRLDPTQERLNVFKYMRPIRGRPTRMKFGE